MSDPFEIEGPAHVSVSGGRTSGYMLWRMLQAHGGRLPAEVIPIFANTGKEDPATLQFVREMSDRWNVPIRWVEYRYTEEVALRWHEVGFDSASREGEPFEALVRAKQYLPNPVTRFCTIELKIRPIARLAKALGHPGTMDDLERGAIVGIRVDEPRRIIKIGDRKRMPLVAAGVDVREVGAFWQAQPFDLQLPNINGRTLHGNCDLCFLKPTGQVLSLIKEKPARAIWWAHIEDEVGAFASRKFVSTSRFRSDRPSYAQMLAFAGDQRDMFDPDEEAIPCFCGD